MVNITGKFFGVVIGWFIARLDGAIAGFLLGAIFDEFVKSQQGGKKATGTNTGNTSFENVFQGNPIDFDYILVSLSAAVMKSD
ncbi:MAG TPA: hypothetical protein VK809_07130, partial [Bacteroidia bacterium]|nr:hypothetical protein [Bacteroidia bacterium]